MVKLYKSSGATHRQARHLVLLSVLRIHCMTRWVLRLEAWQAYTCSVMHCDQWHDLPVFHPQDDPNVQAGCYANVECPQTKEKLAQKLKFIHQIASKDLQASETGRCPIVSSSKICLVIWWLWND